MFTRQITWYKLHNDKTFNLHEFQVCLRFAKGASQSPHECGLVYGFVDKSLSSIYKVGVVFLRSKWPLGSFHAFGSCHNSIYRNGFKEVFLSLLSFTDRTLTWRVTKVSSAGRGSALTNLGIQRVCLLSVVFSPRSQRKPGFPCFFRLQLSFQ